MINLAIGFGLGVLIGGAGIGYLVYRLYFSRRVQALIIIVSDPTTTDAEKVAKIIEVLF